MYVSHWVPDDGRWWATLLGQVFLGNGHEFPSFIPSGTTLDLEIKICVENKRNALPIRHHLYLGCHGAQLRLMFKRFVWNLQFSQPHLGFWPQWWLAVQWGCILSHADSPSTQMQSTPLLIFPGLSWNWRCKAMFSQHSCTCFLEVQET